MQIYIQILINHNRFDIQANKLGNNGKSWKDHNWISGPYVHIQAFISQAVIYYHFHSTDSPQTTNNARMLLYTESIVQSIWQAAI
jgi:hypothetical protein